MINISARVTRIEKHLASQTIISKLTPEEAARLEYLERLNSDRYFKDFDTPIIRLKDVDENFNIRRKRAMEIVKTYGEYEDLRRRDGRPLEPFKGNIAEMLQNARIKAFCKNNKEMLANV